MTEQTLILITHNLSFNHLVKRVFAIYGLGGHLGHVTNTMLINFHFDVPKSLLTKFGFKREKQVLISYANDLGPRARNDPDLQYLHTFTNSIICLHLPTLRSHTGCKIF